MTTPTKRQLEALRQIYRGKSMSQRDPELAPMARRWGSSMGGAVGRMKQTMGEAGWLVERTTTMGRAWYSEALTTAGLQVVARHFPAEPALAERIAASEDADAEQAALEREAAANRERQRLDDADRRRVDRIAALRELLQGYQVRHELSDDQIEDLWLTIIDKEFAL